MQIDLPPGDRPGNSQAALARTKAELASYRRRFNDWSEEELDCCVEEVWSRW
jgi:hypothetical protein